MTDTPKTETPVTDALTAELAAPEEIVEHMALARGYPEAPPEHADEQTTARHELDVEAWWQDFEARELDDADFLARRRRIFRGLRNARTRAMEAELAQITEWHARATERFDAEIKRCEDRLVQFHRRQIERNEKANKTIELPSGVTLTSTAGRLRVEVDNAEKLVAWLEEHEAGDCLRYKPAEPDKKAIGERFGGKATTMPGDAPLVDPETGEVIEGARIVKGDRTYEIKP